LDTLLPRDVENRPEEYAESDKDDDMEIKK